MRPPAIDEEDESDDVMVDAAVDAPSAGDAFDPKKPCGPGTTVCSKGKLWTCRPDGKGMSSDTCPSNKPLCWQGACRVCAPGTLSCGLPADGKPSREVLRCAEDGMGREYHAICETDEVCHLGACRLCVPGSRDCDGTRVRVCAANGSSRQMGWDCAADGLLCEAGVCEPACKEDHAPDGHLGCAFWAVDLELTGKGPDRGFDGDNAPFGVWLTNDVGVAATVVIRLQAGEGQPHEHILKIPPHASKVVELPPPAWKLPPQSLSGSGIAKRAFLIRSSHPIAAAQLNPIAGDPLASADGSLLLPVASLGTGHRVVALPQSPEGWRAGYAVVAVMPGETAVTLFSTAPTLAGQGVPALQPGQEKILYLQRGEVLHVQTDAPGADPSGTWVGASQKVAVFSGTEMSLSPDPGHCVPSPKGGKRCAGTFGAPISCTQDLDCPSPCCGDHIETQLLPTSAWGSVFAVARLPARGAEVESYIVVAGQDKTIVNLKPPIGTLIPQLDRGQRFRFRAKNDFVATSNVPVQLVRVLAGSQATVTTTSATCQVAAECKSKHGFEGICDKGAGGGVCVPLGDPSLLVEVPVDRFRKVHAVAAPGAYIKRWLQIVAPAGAKVTLDGEAMPPAAFSPIAGSSWRVARVPVTAGHHRVAADQPAGVVVYAWGRSVSAAWPGGLSAW